MKWLNIEGKRLLNPLRLKLVKVEIYLPHLKDVYVTESADEGA